jgi:sulfonate transport system permease protein
MTQAIRESQTPPLPDVIDGPGLGFLTLAAGLRLPRLDGGALLRELGQRALPWLVPVGLKWTPSSRHTRR